MRNLLFLITLLPAVTLADNAMPDMEMLASQAVTPAQKADQAGMEKMHKGMMNAMKSRNADVAFARGMRAHHQGAIDMAKTELQYGKDPQMRQLAQTIIAAQQKEIAQMDRWLQAHPEKRTQIGQ